MRNDERSLLALEKEFATVSLGDERLDKRLGKMVQRVGARPAESFPKQMGSEAEQEATYRFFGNRRVTLDKMLTGHRQQTLARIGNQATVRVVHDTTRFQFDGDR